jgi:hypothetical protein
MHRASVTLLLLPTVPLETKRDESPHLVLHIFITTPTIIIIIMLLLPVLVAILSAEAASNQHNHQLLVNNKPLLWRPSQLAEHQQNDH